MPTEYIAHFSLWGDFKADEITTALGLQPSCVYPKGEVMDGASFPNRVETWDFYCPSGMTMHEQVEFLLALLWPRAEVLRTLTARFKGAMNIAGAYENAQVLNLTVETMQKLVSLNVTLNCFYLKDELDDAD